MYTAEQLEQMRSIDITKADPSTLVDLNGIHLDPTAPYEERMQQYFAQVKNPYAFRVGDVAVKVEFAQDGRTLRDAVTSYLTTLKNNA